MTHVRLKIDESLTADRVCPQGCGQPESIKAENEMDRKPGSVLNDDLSRPAIADRFMPPSGHASSAVRPI